MSNNGCFETILGGHTWQVPAGRHQFDVESRLHSAAVSGVGWGNFLWGSCPGYSHRPILEWWQPPGRVQPAGWRYRALDD